MHPIRFRPPFRRNLTTRERGAFKLANVFRQLTRNGCVDGLERELLQDDAAKNDHVFDPMAPYIPWALLDERGMNDPTSDPMAPDIPWPRYAFRDMTVAGASGSNYLVGTDVASPADVLRPWSVVAQGGVSILSGLEANLSVPKTDTTISTYWLTSESTTITEGQPIIGVKSLSPKHGAAFLQYSRLLTLQAPELEEFLRRDLLRAIGTMLDAAVLNGSGASGQPLGLFGTSGVNTQSGTSLAWATGVTEMQRLCAVANGEPSAWIGTPDTRKILQGRERFTGAGSIWHDNTIAGAPAFASMAAPTASLCTGDWSQCLVVLWGPGPQISIDPSTGFRSNILGMRVSLACDVAILSPAAFCVSATVT